ncbi:MAG TPA: hypothetical protein VK607_08210, partial [Kofleriaceae bacterium]|nr:hypothetical protein [Kofleriaceae bacterium]
DDEVESPVIAAAGDERQHQPEHTRVVRRAHRSSAKQSLRRRYTQPRAVSQEDSRLAVIPARRPWQRDLERNQLKIPCHLGPGWRHCVM